MAENALQQQTIEDELWSQYKTKRDPAIRDKFIRQYAPLVKYVAGKVAASMPNTVEFEDLVGFGVFGLLDAIEKFDPDKNVKFKTYAVTRIRGAIFDELRSIDWVPRSVRQKTKEIEEAIVNLEAKFGRPVTDLEVASSLGVSEDDFLKTGDESDKISIGESIESPASMNPDSTVEREEVKRVIVQAINDLPEKEKKVLVLYYYEDLTLKEIGQVLEVTESRVSQLHTKAILRLRAKLTNLRRGII
jgi:RNA polymerase sigma factor for flagellar operon FliA